VWSNPFASCLGKATGLVATVVEITSDIFKFDGQSRLDTFSIDLGRCSEVEAHRLQLAMEAIRWNVDSFPFWQRRKRVGRPSSNERTIMIGFLVQQLFRTTFRDAEGLLNMLRWYFRIDRVPDHSVLCRAMSSRRWTSLLERFFSFFMERLPKRNVIVATDATGYSGRKRGWRETPYAHRPNEDWVKTHAAIEVDSFLILSYELTASNVHDSQVFSDVWERLPKNIVPVRSLADSAYHGEAFLAAARLHGATPLHKIKKNAKGLMEHRVNYNKLVFFAKQFPQRFAALTAKRNHAETVFSMIGNLFGHRIRCRKSDARENEVRCKLIMFNLHQLAVTGLARSL